MKNNTNAPELDQHPKHPAPGERQPVQHAPMPAYVPPDGPFPTGTPKGAPVRRDSPGSK